MAELPDTLIQAACDRRLVPFVGAGVSMSVKTTDNSSLFMSWADLIRNGAQYLRGELGASLAEYIESAMGAKKYLEAAESLKDGLGGLFGTWVSKALSRQISEANPSSLALPQAIWDLGSDLVLTTNYDRVLRWSCPRAADLEEWTIVPSALSIERIKQPTVWHLHGSVGAPVEIVFTKSDYEKWYKGVADRAEAFRTVLRDVTRNRTLIFVGFSMDDAYLENELAWLDKCFPSDSGRHFILVDEARAAVTEEKLKNLKALQIVRYPHHGQPLLSLINDLCLAAQPNRLLKNERTWARPTIDSAGPELRPTSNSGGEQGHSFFQQSGNVASQEPNKKGVSSRSDVALEDYLALSQSLNGVLHIPGWDRHVPIEDVWLEPKISGAEGETRLSRVLSRRAIAFVAPGGYGKSTLAKLIVTLLARDRMLMPCPRGKSWQGSYLGVEPGETQFPLLINLKDVEPRDGLASLLHAAIPAIPHESVDKIRELVDSGAVAFVLDGLDEATSTNKTTILELLSSLQSKYSGCYFILTTRDGLQYLPTGFGRVVLPPLSPNEALKLMERWAYSLSESASEAKTFLDRAQSILDRNADLRSMINTPLLISLLCWNYYTSGVLPTSRASLFDSLTEWLIDSRSKQRAASGIDTPTSMRVMQAIAYYLANGVKNEGPSAAAPIVEVVEGVYALTEISKDKIEITIAVESEFRSCITADFHKVAFWHIAVRDYFAALWLFKFHDARSDKSVAPEVDRAFRDPRWREIADLFVGLVTLRSPQKVEGLIYAIGDMAVDKSPAERLIVSALRSRILLVAGNHGYKASSTLKEILKNEMIVAVGLTDDQLCSIAPNDRIAAFGTLGALQLDNRLKGKPTHRALPLKGSVLLGRFPVTVQEYAKFIRSGGYENSRWWPERWWAESYKAYDAPDWRTPLAWDDQKTRPNSAIVGVSLHEALAYCHWLTEELGSSHAARLPKLDEWEFALLGRIDGSKKETPSSTRGIIQQRRFPDAPVGIFPEYRGALGHDDMGGTIFEWIMDPRLSRRKRRRVSSVRMSDGSTEVAWSSGRGRQRSMEVGFRVLFEELSNRGGRAFDHNPVYPDA